MTAEVEIARTSKGRPVVRIGRLELPVLASGHNDDYPSAEAEAVAALFAAAPDLLKYAERALEWITDKREEECWCYDEVDGAPDAPPPSPCLACRLRDTIAKAKGE